MKLKYIKNKKLNYEGKQYHQGDIFEWEGDFDNIRLPIDWFELIEEDEESEKSEVIERKPKKSRKKKEVDSNGNSENYNENLGSKGRNSTDSEL